MAYFCIFVLKNGRKSTILRLRMSIFGTIHRINMKKPPAKLYDNNLNSSIYRNFWYTKIGHISESMTIRDERQLAKCLLPKST